MKQTIYIDKNENGLDGPIAILMRDTAVVYTGLEIHTEYSTPLLAEISRLCGLNFFQSAPEPAIPLYGVPYITVFATDGRDGWFAASSSSFEEHAIYHIAPDLSIRFVSEYLGSLLEEALQDPGWRQKKLPGSSWPRLPGDQACRAKLAQALHFPRPKPEKPEKIEPPQIFPSRAAAEKKFPIQDIWAILRQKKTPRFQVHPMMSPADREGRALVHHAAWHETYTGLMPDGILAAHTLEKCRNIAASSPQHNTLVLLDQEDEGRVVGFACYMHNARASVSVPDAAEITALYVLRAYQGLGLGRMLLEHCLSHISKERTALFVLKGNENAIRFYEHMGFRPTGHTVTSQLEGETITSLELCLDRECSE